MTIKPIQSPHVKNLFLGNLFLILSNFFFDRDFFYIFAYSFGSIMLWLGVAKEKLTIDSGKITHTPGLGDDIFSLVGLSVVTTSINTKDIGTITLVHNRNGRCVQLKDSKDQKIKLNILEYPLEKIHEIVSQLKKDNSSIIVSPEIKNINQNGLTLYEQSLNNIIIYVFVGINIIISLGKIYSWFVTR